jgi:hypothetical protein
MLNEKVNALQNSGRKKDSENMRTVSVMSGRSVAWQFPRRPYITVRRLALASQRLELQCGSALLLSRALNSAPFLSLSYQLSLSVYPSCLSLYRVFINTGSISFHSIKRGSPSPNYRDSGVYGVATVPE